MAPPKVRVGMLLTASPATAWSDRWRADGREFRWEAGALSVRVWAAREAGGHCVTVQLVNTSRQTCTLSRAFLRWESPVGELDATAALRVAYCGAHSRSAMSRSFVTPLGGGDEPESWWVGALVRAGGDGAVMGSLGFTMFASSVRLARRSAELTFYLERTQLAPGEALALPAVWLARAAGAPFDALETYADLVGRAHGFVSRAPACGWGSWGHFLERIDAGIMRETLLAVAGTASLRDVIGVVQIDDGWSELLNSGRVSASWLPNRRFESGIAPLASQITRTGRDCGLWILPFTVNGGSELAETHPEYLVQNAMGLPFEVAGGSSYCVDPTHPGGRDWLRDVFTHIRDWGVRYVKLDFLRALLTPDPAVPVDDFETPRRYHAAVTRVQAYREGLRVIREAVGDTAYLVGCSAPTAAGVGLIDAHRIGPDIEPAWEGRHSGIREAVTSLAANWFWQGRTWTNDPDYLVTAPSQAESRFWATAVALSGGAVVISADFPTLAPWQERIFSLVTPPTGRSARPLDLFESFEGPRIWKLDLEAPSGVWTLLGLFNWRDRPQEMRVQFADIGLPAATHVWNVWRERHQLGNGGIVLPLEAHDAALLALRPAATHPQVVGSDIHFAQGAVVLRDERWDPDRRRLYLSTQPSLPRSGNLFLHEPGAARLRRIRVKPDESVEMYIRFSLEA